MTDKRISELASGGPGQDADILPAVRAGVNIRLTRLAVLGSLPADVATLQAAIAALSESIDDRVAALLVAGTNITLTYDDVAGTLTIDSAGGGGGAPSVSDHLATQCFGGP